MYFKTLFLGLLAVLTVEAVRFDCVFGPSYNYDVVGSTYTCTASVTLTGSTALESVAGSHQPGKTNDDVRTLNIEKQTLSFFPEGIEKVFKNLVIIRMYDTPLLSIKAKDLQHFPQIQYFAAANASLTTLDSDLFSFTPNISFINLQSNQIQHVGLNLVTNLEKLNILYLLRNPCVNKNAATRADVLNLASTLPSLCPPLETIATTTEGVGGECPCSEKIEELRLESQHKMEQKNREIQDLQQTNEKLFEATAALENRFKNVEMQIREAQSSPCAH